MPDQFLRTRLLAAAAALAIIAPALILADVPVPALALQVREGAHALTGQAGAPSVQDGGLPAGPAQISPLGHPGLCWEAWGDGSAVTLEACDAALQGQQWTFTGNGVLLNGNGYCLQHGGPAGTGNALYLSFSGQCAGAASQQWAFDGTTNSIENAPGGLCAYAAGTGLAAGAVITARRCGSAGSWDAWSQGVSDLTLSVPHQGPGAPAGGGSGTGGTAAHRAFTAEVTVSNPGRVMTAYAAAVLVRPPDGLTVTRLVGSGGLAGWACAVRALECRGNLGGGSSGKLTITGTVARRPDSDVMSVHATVSHTNQVRHAALTATVPVRIYTVAASRAAGEGVSHSMLSSSAAAFGLIVAVVLVGLGIFLAVVARRRQQTAPAKPSTQG